MSRLARKTIPIISGVTCAEKDGTVVFKGPLGELGVPILSGVAIENSAEGLKVSPKDKIRQTRANVGTMWSLLNNAQTGVAKGFSKTLEIQGVGFRANMDGNVLVLNLGFVNPVRFDVPKGLKIEIEKNLVKVSGIDAQAVGQAAAVIRSFKKPEPYKGKGIRYQGEYVRMKAGKKAATAK